MPKRPAKATTATNKKGGSPIAAQVRAELLPFMYDEHAPVLYTDGIQMMASQFGVVLLLTQTELGPERAPRQRHVATLHMSTQHADALLEALKVRQATQSTA